jgi:hypothetical protein
VRLVPAAARQAAARGVASAPRMPFVLLVLALLGGGLVCLLVINTTLGATSFEIDRLQQNASNEALQESLLQQQVATDESPARIEREACALGMRPEERPVFLDLRTHRIDAQPASGLRVATPAWCAR